MKWFNNWFRKKCERAWEEAREERESIKLGASIRPIEDNSINMDNSLRFNVLPAQGGTVIEVRQYDRRDDRNSTSTYVIPDNEDLSTSIAHIVSMELMKKG
jgi:hypothetical protein